MCDGPHGHKNKSVAQLRCIAADSGKVQWSVADFGVAHLLLIRDQLLLLTVDGRLVLAEASPQKFQTLATARISQHVTRALPALSDGRLYVREHAGREGTVRCLQLSGHERQ
jgi:glucose/arabinose dehydrogenase